MSPPLVDDVIDDILLRLRVKDLLSFRCLSKSLCTKIDSPAFVNAHHRRSVETKTHRKLGVFLGNDYDEGYMGIDLDDDIDIHRFIKLNKPYHYSNPILCSCNGLILFGNRDEGTLELWNPSTRRSKKLTSTPYRPRAYIGLGHDSTTNDYKVVIIYLSEAMIFHVATNTWIEVTIETPLLNPLSRVGVFANGALHWLSSNKYVYSFHTSRQTFAKIPPPNLPQFYISYSLQVLGGRLVLGLSNYVKTLELYEAVDDNSWRKLYTIDLTKLRKIQETVTTKFGMVGSCILLQLEVLELSKDGNKILLYISGLSFLDANLYWYDLQRGAYQPVAIQYQPVAIQYQPVAMRFRRHALVCCESLASFGTEFM